MPVAAACCGRFSSPPHKVQLNEVHLVHYKRLRHSLLLEAAIGSHEDGRLMHEAAFVVQLESRSPTRSHHHFNALYRYYVQPCGVAKGKSNLIGTVLIAWQLLWSLIRKENNDFT